MCAPFPTWEEHMANLEPSPSHTKVPSFHKQSFSWVLVYYMHLHNKLFIVVFGNY